MPHMATRAAMVTALGGLALVMMSPATAAGEVVEASTTQVQLHEQGTGAVEEGELETAIRLFEGVLALGEIDVTHVELAGVHQRRGDCTTADDYYRRALEAPSAPALGDEVTLEVIGQRRAEMRHDCPDYFFSEESRNRQQQLRAIARPSEVQDAEVAELPATPDEPQHEDDDPPPTVEEDSPAEDEQAGEEVAVATEADDRDSPDAAFPSATPAVPDAEDPTSDEPTPVDEDDEEPEPKESAEKEVTEKEDKRAKKEESEPDEPPPAQATPTGPPPREVTVTWHTMGRGASSTQLIEHASAVRPAPEPEPPVAGDRREEFRDEIREPLTGVASTGVDGASSDDEPRDTADDTSQDEPRDRGSDTPSRRRATAAQGGDWGEGGSVRGFFAKFYWFSGIAGVTLTEIGRRSFQSDIRDGLISQNEAASIVTAYQVWLGLSAGWTGLGSVLYLSSRTSRYDGAQAFRELSNSFWVFSAMTGIFATALFVESTQRSMYDYWPDEKDRVRSLSKHWFAVSGGFAGAAILSRLADRSGSSSGERAGTESSTDSLSLGVGTTDRGGFSLSLTSRW